MSFPFVCVSVGSCGTRSDRVFRDAYWDTDLDGQLVVFREVGSDVEEELARFSAGSGWIVYACDEHGTPVSPSRGSGLDVPERDGRGVPDPGAESAPSPALAAGGETVTIVIAKTCPRCGGCGRIANDVDGTPWSFWEALAPGSDAAVRAGIVQPVTCPDCGGKGSPS